MTTYSEGVIINAMDFEKTIDFVELGVISAYLTSRKSGIVNPPVQLYPNSERNLKAVTISHGRFIERYSPREILTIFEDPTNNLLTIFMNDLLEGSFNLNSIRIIDPQETEFRFFWQEFPGITYRPETLIRIPLSPRDFPSIVGITFSMIDQRGAFPLVADPIVDNSPRIDIIYSAS